MGITIPLSQLGQLQAGPTENILVEANEEGHFTARIDGEKEGTASRYAKRIFGPLPRH